MKPVIANKGYPLKVYVFSYLGLPRQAGQKSLLQIIVSSRSFVKNFFSLASNSEILRVILLCSSGKSCQILGKLKSGKESRLAKLECTGLNWSRFRSWMSFSPIFHFALSTQVLSKEAGKNFCLKRCMN